MKRNVSISIAFSILAGSLTGSAFAQTVPKDAADQLSANQDTIFRFQKKISYPIVSFAVNNLGELYVINTGNELKKFDDKRDSAGVFNQVTKYGKLSYVDAQNPWRTILFYEDFSNIVLLDKYLNIVSSINLRNQNIFGVKAVSGSYDNNIWLFDEQENKLKKIDDAGNTLMESNDFRQLFDSVPSPVQILDRDGFVYLYDPKRGVYVFDYYGTFKNRLLFLNYTEIGINNKNIYGLKDGKLTRYNSTTLAEKQFHLPFSYSSFKIANNKVYLLRQAGSGSLISEAPLQFFAN